MRQYINLFEKHTNYHKVVRILKNLGLDEWNIGLFLSIDDRGVVYSDSFKIENQTITKLPFNFYRIEGDFIVRNCSLTTLKGSPDSVSANFDVSNNQITSLVGSPSSVNSSYIVRNNPIETLEGSPKRIRHRLDVSSCKNLTTLKGISKTLGQLVVQDCPNLSPWEMRYILFSKILVSSTHQRIPVMSDNDELNKVFIDYFTLENGTVNSEDVYKERIPETLEKLKQLS